MGGGGGVLKQKGQGNTQSISVSSMKFRKAYKRHALFVVEAVFFNGKAENKPI